MVLAFLIWRLVMWHSGLSQWLWLQCPVWVQVCVLSAALLILLPANGLGKAGEGDPSTWDPTTPVGVSSEGQVDGVVPPLTLLISVVRTEELTLSEGGLIAWSLWVRVEEAIKWCFLGWLALTELFLTSHFDLFIVRAPLLATMRAGKISNYIKWSTSSCLPSQFQNKQGVILFIFCLTPKASRRGNMD